MLCKAKLTIEDSSEAGGGFVFERLVGMDANAQAPWMDSRRLSTNKTAVRWESGNCLYVSSQLFQRGFRFRGNDLGCTQFR